MILHKAESARSETLFVQPHMTVFDHSTHGEKLEQLALLGVETEVAYIECG